MPVPVVKRGLQTHERKRTKSGKFRKKRSDAGKTRDKIISSEEEGRETKMRESQGVPEKKTKITKYQLKLFGERLKNNPELIPLEKKLLEYGGARMVPLIPEPHLGILLSGRMELFRNDLWKRVNLNMPSSECHINTATLYQYFFGSRIIVGYALYNDGLWRQHTWMANTDKYTIIETTENSYLLYAGAFLMNGEAEKFVKEELNNE